VDGAVGAVGAVGAATRAVCAAGTVAWVADTAVAEGTVGSVVVGAWLGVGDVLEPVAS
jgi:hypothetical protein